MEFYLNNNYKISDNKLYIDDIVVKKRDCIYFTCDICNKEVKYIYQNSNRFKKLCQTCRTKKTKLEKYGNENYNNNKQTKETNLKKYGGVTPLYNKEISEKSEQTKLKRYGHKFFNYEKVKETNLRKYGQVFYTSTKEMHEKTKQTNLKKYGVKYIFQIKEIKEKIKKTNLKRYGALFPIQNKEIKEKYYHSMMNKYSVKIPIQNKEIKEKIQISKKDIVKKNFYNNLNIRNETTIPMFNYENYNGITGRYKWKCLICETEFEDYIVTGHIPRCPKCFPYYKSKAEQELANWCKTYTNIIENSRSIIPPYEIDIYLPSYNLAIEYNGLYWHNIEHVDKYYHQNKVKLAYEKGIRLLHIWEHEWLEYNEQTKQVIQYYINNLQEEILPQEPKLYNIYNNLIWI